jgi:hypothetical protein
MDKEFSIGQWVIIKLPVTRTGSMVDRIRQFENNVGQITKIIDKDGNLDSLGTLYYLSFKDETKSGYFQSWCLESYYSE